MSEKDLSLEGRVVLVAGASRGIGEAAVDDNVCKRLLRHGLESCAREGAVEPAIPGWQERSTYHCAESARTQATLHIELI